MLGARREGKGNSKKKWVVLQKEVLMRWNSPILIVHELFVGFISHMSTHTLVP
jgi:hypothetical protein